MKFTNSDYEQRIKALEGEVFTLRHVVAEMQESNKLRIGERSPLDRLSVSYYQDNRPTINLGEVVRQLLDYFKLAIQHEPQRPALTKIVDKS